ncbi:MAG: DUF4494 domain-containing protein [Bacteroidaceae bacterium]|jgi:hypothetical protein|nr:DUF4494 domain-containing protein [Bacteroidaceae bacterium]
MLGNWFECKVTGEKVTENGMTKSKPESYLVDAMSFTDAEARITKEVSPFFNGMIEIKNITPAKISELFINEADDADKWYKVKCNFITLDEKTQTEKRTANYMLVQAANFRGALDRFVEGMKGTMADYEIASIQETPLLDVFPFEVKE